MCRLQAAAERKADSASGRQPAIAIDRLAAGEARPKSIDVRNWIVQIA